MDGFGFLPDTRVFAQRSRAVNRFLGAVRNGVRSEPGSAAQRTALSRRAARARGMAGGTGGSPGSSSPWMSWLSERRSGGCSGGAVPPREPAEGFGFLDEGSMRSLTQRKSKESACGCNGVRCAGGGGCGCAECAGDVRGPAKPARVSRVLGAGGGSRQELPLQGMGGGLGGGEARLGAAGCGSVTVDIPPALRICSALFRWPPGTYNLLCDGLGREVCPSVAGCRLRSASFNMRIGTQILLEWKCYHIGNMTRCEGRVAAHVGGQLECHYEPKDKDDAYSWGAKEENPCEEGEHAIRKNTDDRMHSTFLGPEPATS